MVNTMWDERQSENKEPSAEVFVCLHRGLCFSYFLLIVIIGRPSFLLPQWVLAVYVGAPTPAQENERSANGS